MDSFAGDDQGETSSSDVEFGDVTVLSRGPRMASRRFGDSLCSESAHGLNGRNYQELRNQVTKRLEHRVAVSTVIRDQDIQDSIGVYIPNIKI